MKKLINNRSRVVLVTVLAAVLVLSCAHAVPVEITTDAEPFGFWRGLLHGFILPFSFIGSLFNDEIVVYAINNNGGWYNFGFVFGASCIFGSGGRSAKRRKKD